MSSFMENIHLTEQVSKLYYYYSEMNTCFLPLLVFSFTQLKQSSPLKSLSQIFIKSKSEWNSKLSIYMYTCSLTLEKTSDINGH